MLIRVLHAPIIEVGMWFVQYFPKKNYSFSGGEIVLVDNNFLEVDFGDVQISFCKSRISYVINSDNGDEHFMTTAQGRVVASYRNDYMKDFYETPRANGSLRTSGS